VQTVRGFAAQSQPLGVDATIVRLVLVPAARGLEEAVV
jgi:hypothetical protein